MIANVVWSLRQNPELRIFLTLALGFLLGRLKVGTLSSEMWLARCSRAC